MDDAFDGTDGTEIATDECPWDETTSAVAEEGVLVRRRYLEEKNGNGFHH